MKMLYLFKSLSPFLFFATAPRVVDVEIQQHGLGGCGTGTILSVLVQLVFSLALFFWFSSFFNNRKKESSAFLKMSCVSKKVFHQNKWISVEQYLSENHNIVVSHGLTPGECAEWKRQAAIEAGTDFFRETSRLGTTRKTGPLAALEPATTGAVRPELALR